jgi:hypothetical protein
MKPTGRIVIAGGTGFLGGNLARHLAGMGCEVIVMSRHPSVEDSRWLHAQWDARTPEDWVRHLDGAGALVNLTGRSVDCVKTPDHCDEILRSRVESTEVLGGALRSVKVLPRAWVQMAAAHRYGLAPSVARGRDEIGGSGDRGSREP